MVAVAAIAGLMLPGGAASAAPVPAPAVPGAKVDQAANQVIVTWKPGTTDTQKTAALATLPVRGRAALSATTSGVDMDVLGVASATAVAPAVAALAAAPAVASVEPNRVLHAAGKVQKPPALSSLFNDPLLADGTQWHLLGDDTAPGNSYGADAVRAFRAGVTGNPDVYVGVVDEGVDISHPDLQANVFTNAWDPVNGRDDDRNGFVDDVHGWDFYNNDSTVFDGATPSDLIDAHGTTVAGEIAAVQGDAIGGSGIAPNVKVIPAKFLGPTQGTAAGAIAALDYLTDLKLRHGLNIVATNNSWEGDSEQSQALQAAIQRGADAGIIFVTVAGNGSLDTGKGYSIDTTPNYPASLRCTLPGGADCMITVTAFDSHGKMPKWANWGAKSVDLGAPGVSLRSTFPFNGYESWSGTSMAAPLVAGALALYESKYPAATPIRARHALLQSAVPTDSLTGMTRTGGRLDVAAMLANDHDVWSGNWWQDGRE